MPIPAAGNRRIFKENYFLLLFTQTSHAYLRSVARAFSTPFTWVEYKALFSYYLNKREINKWRRREKEKEKRNKIEEFVIRTTFLDFVRRVDVGGQGGHQGSSNSVIRSPHLAKGEVQIYSEFQGV